MKLKNFLPIPIRRFAKEQWQRIKPPQVVITNFIPRGCKFEITTLVEKYRVLAYGGEEDLIRLFLSEIRPRDIVFDIGSSVGLYAIHAALYGAQVVAFEPDPSYRRRLRRNISLNRLNKRIKVVDWAVSDAKGTTILYTDGIQGNSPSLKQVGDRGSVNVHTNSIDNAISQQLIPRPNIIKIDIEGAEILALRGMKDLLKDKDAPRILIIEMHPDFLEEFHSSMEECTQLIESLGYVQVRSAPRDKQLHYIYRR